MDGIHCCGSMLRSSLEIFIERAKDDVESTAGASDIAVDNDKEGPLL
jgi:hypothetical protein